MKKRDPSTGRTSCGILQKGENNHSYFPVSQKELDEALNRAGKPLFFFKIRNKDLSYAEKFTEGKRKSGGTENMHTLYFKELMSGKQSGFIGSTGISVLKEVG